MKWKGGGEETERPVIMNFSGGRAVQGKLKGVWQVYFLPGKRRHRDKGGRVGPIN